jgi:hypothetical protein
LTIITHLGNKLSTLISISPAAARGLIKLAIKDEFGPFKPYNQLNYEDYKLTLNHSLKSRLQQLDVSQTDKIMGMLNEELFLKQSLITMEVV